MGCVSGGSVRGGWSSYWAVSSGEETEASTCWKAVCCQTDKFCVCECVHNKISQNGRSLAVCGVLSATNPLLIGLSHQFLWKKKPSRSLEVLQKPKHSKLPNLIIISKSTGCYVFQNGSNQVVWATHGWAQNQLKASKLI